MARSPRSLLGIQCRNSDVPKRGESLEQLWRVEIRAPLVAVKEIADAKGACNSHVPNDGHRRERSYLHFDSRNPLDPHYLWISATVSRYGASIVHVRPARMEPCAESSALNAVRAGSGDTSTWLER